MDKIILQELYEKYGREIYLYLYSLCKDREMAEDLRQETFYKALLSLNSQHTNMRAWLYRVARNLCFNVMKKQNHEILYGDFTDAPLDIEGVSSGEIDTLDRLIKDEKVQALFQCISKLDIQKREILELQYFSGLSLKEIAHLIGKSYENVRVLSSRGRRDLREYMEVAGYEL